MVQETKLKTNWEILPVEHELFEKIIKTIPVSAAYGRILVVAQGIPMPAQNTNTNNQTHERYISSCQKNSVMPYTQVQYSFGQGGFSPKHEASYFTNERSFDEKKKKILSDLVLNGGQIHQIEIDLWNAGGSCEPFNNFKDEFLDQLTEKGYRIIRGQLNLHKRSEYDKTDFLFANDHLYGQKIQLDSANPILAEWLKEVMFR